MVIDKKEKNIQVMRDATEFHKIANTYVAQNLATPDFNIGQVVLIDMGDTDSCALRFEFSSISAKEQTDNTIAVVVNYTVKAAVEKCTPVITRPFYFYHINTRKLLKIEEKSN